MDRVLIEQLIEKHEGRRHGVYKDTMGNLTVGVGWNLEDADSETICEHFGLKLSDLRCGLDTLNDSQISQVFDYQVTATISAAMSVFPNFHAMPDTVQAVVCDMIFNLGLTRFSKFISTICQLKDGNWKQAAIDAGNSLWAKQVPHRAADDIALLNAA